MNLVSSVRPIVKGVINSKEAYFLLDTGTNVALLDLSQMDYFQLDKSNKCINKIIGAGGVAEENYFCTNKVIIGNHNLYGFILTDLSNIISHIQEETNLKILGVISYPQMQIMGMVINCKNNELLET